MKFERLWTCGCCDGPVVYDDQELTISCNCGTVYEKHPISAKYLTDYKKCA